MPAGSCLITLGHRPGGGSGSAWRPAGPRHHQNQNQSAGGRSGSLRRRPRGEAAGGRGGAWHETRNSQMKLASASDFGRGTLRGCEVQTLAIRQECSWQLSRQQFQPLVEVLASRTTRAASERDLGAGATRRFRVSFGDAWFDSLHCSGAEERNSGNLRDGLATHVLFDLSDWSPACLLCGCASAGVTFA